MNTYLDLQKSSTKSWPPMWPYHQCWVSFMFCNLKPSISTPRQKIADKPICCALPNNKKSNPWKTSSKCRLNLNLYSTLPPLNTFQDKKRHKPMCCPQPNNNKSTHLKPKKFKGNPRDALDLKVIYQSRSKR